MNKGAILVATWGYDQTNADFYQVVGTTPKGVKIRHLKSKIVQQNMIGTATPIKGSFDGETKNRRVYYSEAWNTEAVDIGESRGTARVWNGKPVHITSYG